MEELITRHCEIMSKWDPKHKVGLIVDEWGAWYDVEPGTNSGFLYRLNTMRDAVVAAFTLNIFNKYSGRVRMANIAQTVNVLQAVILTDAEKMVLTPTYYVFKIYKDHQENTLIGSYITTAELEDGKNKYPQLVESASIDENGIMYSTVTNTSAKKAVKIKCQIADTKVKSVRAEIISGEMHARNDFDAEETVKIDEFTDFRKLRDGFTATIPACSVVKFVIE